VAVGSIDGEGCQGDVGHRKPARLRPTRRCGSRSSTAALRLKRASAFSAGKVDLAVVRGDVGDLSQAQAVVVVSHVVVLIVAPPGSTIDSMDKLKGRRIGVIEGARTAKLSMC